uniref:Rhamnogalacturonase A/B/Epimerase-like pectate lyase domain-containing protein n=1 Tax=Cyanothece sp. (strain PCC 7425 / ATCC 29141) TaxID=395961 RepID=B8HVJ3_CYAP4
MQSRSRWKYLTLACLLAVSVWLCSSTTACAAKVLGGGSLEEQANHQFPPSAAIINVTQAPYGAKGDGKTDDTAAIQRALNDMIGLHKILYFPNGTYLISASLQWANKNARGQPAWGFNWIQGENPLKTVIRLKNGTFTDPKQPMPLMACGGFGSADWFHNYVQDLTFDVGRSNPSAIGLQFYSNNTGAVRNVAILSQDGQGRTGLDLYRDMNGPLLVQNLLVRGFEVGIRTGAAVNSQTFEQIQLIGQTQFGFDNQGQSISIRGLTSENTVPAVRSYGVLSLLDATLVGRDGASTIPAIVNYNGGRLGLRNITTRGYGRALGDVETPDYAAALRIRGTDKVGSEGPTVTEYFSHPVTSPFAGPAASLGLAVQETPDVPWDDPKTWAVVDTFNADPTGQRDSSAAIQQAIDSGATTIFFPGFYAIEKPVIIRGKARRLIGTGAWIDYQGKSKPDFIVGDGQSKVVVIEHFAPINGGIAVNTNRTVVLRSLESRRISHPGKGLLFLEDVATDNFHLHTGQRVWARQLNIENEGTHLTNAGGDLWVLGYKTERGGTLLHTRAGGRSEIFGTFSYTTTAGKLAPMFVTEDADVFAFFNEVCYTGDPFAVLIEETRKGVTKAVKQGEGTIAPYIGVARQR